MDRYSIELPQLDVEKRTKMTFYLKFERKRRKKKHTRTKITLMEEEILFLQMGYFHLLQR